MALTSEFLEMSPLLIILQPPFIGCQLGAELPITGRFFFFFLQMYNDIGCHKIGGCFQEPGARDAQCPAMPGKIHTKNKCPSKTIILHYVIFQVIQKSIVLICITNFCRLDYTMDYFTSSNGIHCQVQSLARIVNQIVHLLENCKEKNKNFSTFPGCHETKQKFRDELLIENAFVAQLSTFLAY